jgi:putative flippase GtrA
MALLAPGLYSRVRTMLPEMLKFGIVGGIGTVIDLGGAAVLHGKYHVEPLAAKAVSTSLATVLTYLGSRFWTFKHRENQELKREAVLFIVLNLVGLAIAEIVVGLVTYGFNLHGQLEYNAASFVGTGCGTIFRFYAYRRWVFLAPGERADAGPAAVRQAPDYPPWELDPAFAGPARPAARRPVAPPAPLSPWGQQPASGWSREPAPAWSGEPVSAWSRGPAPAGPREPGSAWSREPAPAGPRETPSAWSREPASPWNQAAAEPAWGRHGAPADQRPARRPAPAAGPAERRPGGRHRKS